MRPHGGTPLRSNLTSSEAPVGRTAGQNTEWVNADIMKALRGELPVHIFNHEAIPLWLERFGGKPSRSRRRRQPVAVFRRLGIARRLSVPPPAQGVTAGGRPISSRACIGFDANSL
jgi:hypothetical protein